MYGPMMKTGIKQVKPIAQIGTVTALAKLTEQKVLYPPMMQTVIRQVMPIAQVGTVTALAL